MLDGCYFAVRIGVHLPFRNRKEAAAASHVVKQYEIRFGGSSHSIGHRIFPFIPNITPFRGAWIGPNEFGHPIPYDAKLCLLMIDILAEKGDSRDLTLEKAFDKVAEIRQSVGSTYLRFDVAQKSIWISITEMFISDRGFVPPGS